MAGVDVGLEVGVVGAPAAEALARVEAVERAADAAQLGGLPRERRGVAVESGARRADDQVVARGRRVDRPRARRRGGTGGRLRGTRRGCSGRSPRWDGCRSGRTRRRRRSRRRTTRRRSPATPRPRRARGRGRRRLSRLTSATSSPAGAVSTISTVPAVPSTRTSAPVPMRRVPSVVFATQGTPSSTRHDRTVAEHAAHVEHDAAGQAEQRRPTRIGGRADEDLARCEVATFERVDDHPGDPRRVGPG